MKLTKCLSIAAFVLLGSVPIGAIAAPPAGEPADDLAALKPHLRQSLMWDFPTLGAKYSVTIYYLDETTGPEARDVILYVRNRAWERIGQEDDLSILKDYVSRRFIVMTLDFGNEPRAVSPAIDDDINLLHRAIFGYKTPSILRAIKLEPKPVRCFIMPAGYRVATDLTFWEIDKHGVYGTLEYIMKTYNEEIVPKVPGMKPAEKPSDMVDRNGKPFDYGIRMDIVYPSQPRKKCPVFVYSDTQPTRDAHHRYLFQLRGYVYVVMGHCFNPCVTHYWHLNKFTLDHWNGLACYTAAMRYLNMHADTYSMDTDRIGMMGISKGQYAVTRLSPPGHEAFTESRRFPGFPLGTPEPQPWQGHPSRIHAGWQGMGMGLWETEYITPDYAPTILACGENDRDVITQDGNVRFLAALEKLDVNHVNLFMEGLGHAISLGYDKRLGVDRYQLVIDFFDRYLRAPDRLPPVVLIASPRDGAENVDPSAPIWVQFAPVIDETTVLDGKGIRVTSAGSAAEVKGTWKASHGGTKFTFVPEAPLAGATPYEVSVTGAVRDKAGNALQAVRTIRFKTAG
ncbi:MAG: hypothetical protein GXY74_05230 [Phycisphaerae bacterium]|nr:hypothetical protein [Phycisphaerae bacterium]